MFGITETSLVLLSSARETKTKAEEICSTVKGKVAVINQDYDVQKIKQTLFESYGRGVQYYVCVQGVNFGCS